MRVGVKYVGPMGAFSGYGSASRGFVKALDSVGVEVTTLVLSYDNNEQNWFGEDYKVVRGLEGKSVNYDIKIIHVPCHSYAQHLEPCKYHIGRLAWETDKMSPEWVWNCNLMDEIWTGCEKNKIAFEKSGVKVPIWIFPETLDTSMRDTRRGNWEIPDHDGFLFFSIFQWIERKNPRLLIDAYLKEFETKDNVGLLIKTYKDTFAINEEQEIASEILGWKSEIKRNNQPPIYVNVQLMDKNDIFRIYQTGDCFVLPHYGEGWGRPIAEALLYDKPVIATNLGGIHDHLTRECYFPLNYELVPVSGMEWAPHYRPDQKWGQAGIGELRNKMRYVYEHQKEAKGVGKVGGGFVRANFNYETVGGQMKNRLISIQEMIDSERKKGIRWL